MKRSDKAIHLLPLQSKFLFCMQYRTAVSLAAGLLARLDRRLADEKEGLGYETRSHTLAATRAAFKESFTSGSTDGHYEHIAPEVGKFGLNLVYILQSPGAEQVRQTWRPPDQCLLYGV